jgi:prepilin-type N-terminal cleavage/methylation domain-containing protein
MPPTRKQSGFTLLEVVMAITIGSGVVLMLFVGLRISMNALRRGNERLESTERQSAEFDAVQSQMSGAIPRTISQAPDGRPLNVLCFRGSAQQVQFVTRSSWAGSRSPGLWLASYRVVEQKDGQQQLMIGETGMPDSDHFLQALIGNDSAPERSEPFGEPADRIELLYWESGSEKNPPSWVSDWKAAGQEELPRGIQIHWQSGQTEQTATFLIPVVEEVK